jgi:peroxiredoxin Q/BCP
MLKVGDVAPDFVLPLVTGMVSLSGLRGKRVVLYFYPKDDTPGCTKEACSFRDHLPHFEEKGAVVLGVSPDPVRSHEKFAEKYQIPFILLADVDHRVAEAYGVWGQKRFMGREYMGVLRTTFVIDEEGRVTRVFEDVKPDEHATEVLAALA